MFELSPGSWLLEKGSMTFTHLRGISVCKKIDLIGEIKHSYKKQVGNSKAMYFGISLVPEDIIIATINVLNSDVFENSFFFLSLGHRITENLMIGIL